MNGKFHNNDPVIIGGFGGSGTRVVAEILKICNFMASPDLNNSNDDLLFTYLFKFPQKYKNRDYVAKNYDQIEKMLGLHKKLFFKKQLNIYEVLKLFSIGYNHHFYNHYYNWKWVLTRMNNMLLCKEKRESTRWFFKEPHTTFFLQREKDKFFHCPCADLLFLRMLNNHPDN
ncbi:MAG: hypothetical protein GF353_20875, partial [Candidatus Lokiarchaeota archaeon]|nr:hypothetical protein [Candidatus Lokiarchaeota archaeon]